MKLRFALSFVLQSGRSRRTSSRLRASVGTCSGHGRPSRRRVACALSSVGLAAITLGCGVGQHQARTTDERVSTTGEAPSDDDTWTILHACSVARTNERHHASAIDSEVLTVGPGSLIWRLIRVHDNLGTALVVRRIDAVAGASFSGFTAVESSWWLEVHSEQLRFGSVGSEVSTVVRLRPDSCVPVSEED